jgi:hypothetical protein
LPLQTNFDGEPILTSPQFWTAGGVPAPVCGHPNDPDEHPASPMANNVEAATSLINHRLAFISTRFILTILTSRADFRGRIDAANH